jgi:ferredoxin
VTLNILLDTRRCSGFASCLIVAPSVFDLDEAEGKAVLLRDDCPPELLNRVTQAARDCPTGAIELVGDGG